MMEVEDRINKKIDELVDRLDSINSSIREEHRQNPIRVAVISELNKQYRECFYALDMLEKLMKST